MAITPPPEITPPPPAPVRGDRATFSGRVDAFVTWLIYAVTQFAGVAASAYANAVAAAASATAAIAAAASAVPGGEAAKDLLNRYYGWRAVAPTTRPDGTSMQPGDRYFDTISGREKTFNGSLWYVPNIDSAEFATTAGAGMSGFDPTYPYQPGTIGASLRGSIHVLNYLTPAQTMNAYLRLGNVDSGPQLQQAINAAANKKLVWPAGYFIGSGQELIVRTVQVWQGGGKGNMLYPFSRENVPGTVLQTVGNGTAYKTVKTRVLYRSSAADPQDAPISALVNVQHQGFEIRDMVVRCSYDENTIWSTPNYFGDDWDVGLFVGCRIHCKIERVAVVGCWRDRAIRHDVTRGLGLPEMFGWDGIQHPVDYQYGGDGCTMNEVITWGGRWGVSVRGADPKPGLISYGKDYKLSLFVTVVSLPNVGDTLRLGEVTLTFDVSASDSTTVSIGATVEETASNICAVCSDLVDASNDNPIFRSAIYAPDGSMVRTFQRDPNATTYNAFTASTASGGRIALSGSAPSAGADPAPYYDQALGAAVPDGRGGYGFSDFTIKDSQIFGSESPTKYARQMIRADKNWLIDTGGGAFEIDGLAANASRMLQGHRYWNVRFDGSYDPFNVRLGRTHRDEFFGCQFDGTGTVNFFRPDGTPTGAVLSALKYGPITRMPGITKRTRMYSQDSTPYSAYFKLDDAGSAFIASRGGGMTLTGLIRTINGNIEVDQRASSAAYAELVLRSGQNAQGVIRFRKGSSSLTQAAIRYRAADDSLALEAVGGLRLNFVGGTLSDYRTGTWTPTIYGLTTAGVNTYSIQVGEYQKVGNVVVLIFRVTLAAKDLAMAGTVQIGGLPFAIAHQTLNIHASKLGYYMGITLGASDDLTAMASSAVPLGLTLFKVSNSAAVSIQPADVSDTATIRGTIIYRAA